MYYSRKIQLEFRILVINIPDAYNQHWSLGERRLNNQSTHVIIIIDNYLLLLYIALYYKHNHFYLY